MKTIRILMLATVPLATASSLASDCHIWIRANHISRGIESNSSISDCTEMAVSEMDRFIWSHRENTDLGKVTTVVTHKDLHGKMITITE